jgi:hypothetical protein
MLLLGSSKLFLPRGLVKLSRIDPVLLQEETWARLTPSKLYIHTYETTKNELNIVYFRTFDSSLSENEWTHLCFILSDKTKLSFFINSLQLPNTILLSHEVTIKGTGTLVPAFDQISPGVVNISSGSHLNLTRLYIKDTSSLDKFEIFRVFNEPKFAMLNSEPFRVDWKKFYHTNSSALIAPSDEPDIGRSIQIF